MREAFLQWSNAQRRKKHLTDEEYAEMVRVIRSQDRNHPSYQVWRKAGYLVRVVAGVDILYRNVALGRAPSRKSRGDNVNNVNDDSEPDSEESISPALPSPNSQPKPKVCKVKRVPAASDIITLIDQGHSEKLHVGVRMTYQHLAATLTSIPRKVVQAFVARCVTCLKKASKKKKTKPVIQGIFSSRFNERTQMDLYDMQQTPGGPNKNYRYVFHYVDHFTKFSILRAIKDKTMVAICRCLEDIWSLMGAPDLLQSDNGTEFKNQMVVDLCLAYGVKHVHGRAYHPQTQGAVERANGFAKRLMLGWIADRPKGIDWLPGLNKVQMEMNRSVRQSIGQTPYKMVFNRDHSTEIDRSPVEAVGEPLMLFSSDSDASADEDAISHVEEAARQHDKTTQAAKARSTSNKQNMVDRHNARATQVEFAPGDLVTIPLRKKTLTALDLPRMVMMVIRVVPERGTANVWCQHGWLSEPVGLADLIKVPESERPEGMFMNCKDVALERQYHLKTKGTPIGFDVSMSDLIDKVTAGNQEEGIALTQEQQRIVNKQVANEKRKKAKKRSMAVAEEAAAAADDAAPITKKTKQSKKKN